MSNFDVAITALRGPRWAIAEAPRHVPAAPGLYAIYGDAQAWTDIGLPMLADAPLYLGKAEESLARRELEGHFAASSALRARTGSSTVRRSFAALLRESLSLRGIPRNPERPGYFSSYGLTADGDIHLTTWMHAHLTIAVWAAPRLLGEPLVQVERAVIAHWTPPLNLTDNPHPAPGLKAARSVMAAQARTWRPEDGS